MGFAKTNFSFYIFSASSEYNAHTPQHTYLAGRALSEAAEATCLTIVGGRIFVSFWGMKSTNVDIVMPGHGVGPLISSGAVTQPKQFKANIEWMVIGTRRRYFIPVQYILKGLPFVSNLNVSTKRTHPEQSLYLAKERAHDTVSVTVTA